VNLLENSVGYFHLSSDFKERIILPTTAYNVLKKEIDIATIMVKERFGCLLSAKELVCKGNSTAIILKATLHKNIQGSSEIIQRIIRPDVIHLRWYLFKRIIAKNFSHKIDKIVSDNGNCTFVSRESRTKKVKIYGPKKERVQVFAALQKILKQFKEPEYSITLKLWKSVIDKNGKLSTEFDKFKGELSIDLKRKTINLYSTENEYNELVKVVRELDDKYLKNKKQGQNENCMICSYEIENPFQFSNCSHRVCTACAKLQFESISLDQPFLCSTYEAPVVIQDLKILSNANEFEEKCSISLN
jgi:hypothetical protein